jgi:hypothetical protein
MASALVRVGIFALAMIIVILFSNMILFSKAKENTFRVVNLIGRLDNYQDSVAAPFNQTPAVPGAPAVPCAAEVCATPAPPNPPPPIPAAGADAKAEPSHTRLAGSPVSAPPGRARVRTDLNTVCWSSLRPRLRHIVPAPPRSEPVPVPAYDGRSQNLKDLQAAALQLLTHRP